MKNICPPLKTRLRRLRVTTHLRELVKETDLKSRHLVLPLFIKEGKNIKNPINSMPGQFQFSPDRLEEEIESILDAGIQSILLFGIPKHKDAIGSTAFAPDGIIQSTIPLIKKMAPGLLVMTDLCFCEYTDHGHCGVVNSNKEIDNDQTLELLAKQALSHAKAGADIVAPSGMMDGQVGAIRHHLDQHNFQHLPILSYSVKYASALYGPFREAAEGAPQFGDRRSYQMDFSNASEALRECQLDIEEGADMLMVKPAHTYLDIIRLVKQTYPAMPLGAYHTSGEYVMLKAAIEKGWLKERESVLEVHTAIRRAGADFIFTYFAKEIATWLKES